ncbi:MAG TPA: sigma-E factor negative regulatory protein [Steroidobacteraceae bacterium]|nr:sigma-E factor negative regulatory protein [Steroidobacteraceae bacterium]
MTDQIREQLSALLDGELPRDEIGLLVRRLDRNPELRRTFGSYALIGETLRAPGGRIASTGFAARVGAAIGGAADAAPAVHEVRPATSHHAAFWKRPVVRTALAASAAATAVLLFRPDAGNEQVAAEVSPPHVVDSPRYSPTPAQAQRLASYMVAHSQFSTPMVRRNVLTGLLAADPGLTHVSYDMGEAN